MAKSDNTPPPSLEPGALSGPLGAWFKRPLSPWSAHAFTVAIVLARALGIEAVELLSVAEGATEPDHRI